MSKLLEKCRELEGFEVFGFWDKDSDGACPCFGGKRMEDGKTVNVRGRCWRVSDNDQDLYVWGDHLDLKAIAKETKRALDETGWHNPYTIIYEKFE